MDTTGERRALSGATGRWSPMAHTVSAADRRPACLCNACGAMTGRQRMRARMRPLATSPERAEPNVCLGLTEYEHKGCRADCKLRELSNTPRCTVGLVAFEAKFS